MNRILALIALLLLAFPAFAQEQTPDEERSYLVGLVEDQLSTPTRQIRLNNIQGVLSSDASIGEITIADPDGVWLRIVNARIEWTRSALLLGRLQIAKLEAERIEVLRKPLPDESLPSPEATPFKLPELPVSVTLDALNVPHVVFGEGIFGLASEMSVTGRIKLADGSLDSALEMVRLDGPGGQLSLAAKFANATRDIALDLKFSEPQNGIVANLLDIEGRPPVGLVLAGEGPLDQLDVSLTLDAAGQRVLTGRTSLRRQTDGLGYTASLDGPIANLIPERFRSFFGRTTTLTASGVAKDEGGMRLENLDLKSAALAIAASAETSADGFLQSLRLDANIGNETGEQVLLPIPGRNVIDSAKLGVRFGEAGSEQWNARLDIAGFATDKFAAKSVNFDIGGVAQNLNEPENRHISFSGEGGFGEISSQYREVAKAMGREITLALSGDWKAGSPLRLDVADLFGNGLGLSMKGTIAEQVFDGDISLKAENLMPFSDLAGRKLAGALNLDAHGKLMPLSGGFDLALDGKANGLKISEPAADALLAGESRIAGALARGEKGLIARQFRLFNDQVSLGADGVLASTEADFAFNLALENLHLISPEAQGKLTATGSAKGSEGTIQLNLDAKVPSGRLGSRALSDAVLSFAGTSHSKVLDGKISGNAFLEGARVTLQSDLSLGENSRRLSDLSFSAGGTNVSGTVQQDIASGLLDGRLAIAAPDISTAAALFLQQAKGSVDATLRLRPIAGKRQDGDLRGQIRDLVIDDTRISSADIEGEFSDLFNVPGGNATINARDIRAGGVVVSRLDAKTVQNADITEFTADAALENGATINLAGSLARIIDGFRIALKDLTLEQNHTSAKLAAPAGISVAGDVVTIDDVAFDVNGGRITARGRLADQLDLDVALVALPLSIANSVKPELGLGGQLDGKLKITGAKSSPNVNFDLAGKSLSASALTQAGISSLDLSAKGQSQGETLSINAGLKSPEGLDATATGNVPLGKGQLGLDVRLAALPLAILNAVAPGNDLAGNITGNARVTGTLEQPAASFNLAGSSISAAPLAEAGAAPLQFTAEGGFANDALTLNSAQVQGPQGLTLSARGTVPLAGAGLGISIAGEAPLALANRLLAERGTQAVGKVTMQADISGSIASPAINGRITASDASVVDPETNLRLTGISASASINGDVINIENVSGAVTGGGKVSANGTISIAPDQGMPANIAINLDNVRYADGDLVVATVNGKISITGALAHDPLIGGKIDVVRAEISVPENFAGGASAIDVRHRNTPKGVAETLKRAKANDGTPVPNARPSVARLDMTVNAPNKVFVRGRGLDAELGGTVRLTGPVTNIQPVGALNMIRGRIGILGQRITFDEGTVTLVGDLDPYLNFVARSEGTDITVFVTVKGRASDVDVSFSSQPELPQDEVLARLIFNRSINELSAFQIAQLAAAAAELAGGGSSSLLNSLRSGTGLDDLDIITDSEGNAGVRAGRYIQDNIYLGVEAGAGGDAKGTINLDITDNLKAKGSMGTIDSSVGIFYEKDY